MTICRHNEDLSEVSCPECSMPDLPVEDGVQCPECGAWDGEWCDTGCTLHRAGSCGLPHPKARGGAFDCYIDGHPHNHDWRCNDKRCGAKFGSPGLPVEDGVEWKRVADELKIGDEVDDWGIVEDVQPDGDHGRCMAVRIESVWFCWPSDAYVPVKKKTRRWQQTVTYTTLHEEQARGWRAGTRQEVGGYVVEYGEVVEL